MPSDAVVALAGFLSRHHAVNPYAVFLSAWSANLVGAGLVYWAARRYGRAFVLSPVGRRVFPSGAVAELERQYLRFGVPGVFLARLIPGPRSAVPPFGGLVNLRPAVVLVPVALAGMVWYAAITGIGVALGSEWESIRHFIEALNRTLFLVGVSALAAIIGWIVWRRRARREDRLWAALHAAFAHDAAAETRAHEDPALAAAAMLLLELARSDRTFDPADLAAIEGRLRERWSLPPAGDPAAEDEKHLAARVTETFDRVARVELYQRLRSLAASGDRLQPAEERLLLRAAALLGLDDADASTREKVS
ncbi:MAG TPA: DedA family protein [Gemmatimonadales bacterium]|nr:DedA family protein [Gemmatimonadales bacterium]